MSNISQIDIDNILDYNFDTSVENWFKRTGDVTETELQKREKNLKVLQEQYLEEEEKATSGQDKQNILSKYQRRMLDARSNDDNSIEIRDQLAFVNGNPSLTGNSWKEFKKSPVGQEMAQIMDGSKELTYDEKNNVHGYEIQGQVLSLEDIRRIIDMHTMDNSSKNVLAGVMEYAQTLGSFEDAGELNTFDIATKIRNEVVEKGNINSLINDNHVLTEGGSFKQDLLNRLQGMKYEDVGITEDMLNNIDKNLKAVKISDGITKDEAELIANELLKDDKLTKDYLTNYFTQHIKDQYNYMYGEKKEAREQVALNNIENYKQGSL